MTAQTTNIKSHHNLELFWEIVKDSSVAMFLMSGETIVACNKATLSLFGCNREALIGRTPADFSPDKQPGGDISTHLVKIRASRVYAGEPQHFTWLHQRADGTPFTVFAYARKLSPPMVPPDDEYLLVELRDVTNEQHSAQQRRDVEDYLQVFQEMIESANDAMLLVENGRIVECNPAACELYGLDRDDLILKQPVELSPEFQPDGQPSEKLGTELMAKAFQGQTQKFTWLHTRGDNSEFMAEVTLNPAQNLNHPGQRRRKRFVAIVRDVTEQYLAKAQLEDLNRRLEQRNHAVEELLEQAHQDPLLHIPTLVRFIELLDDSTLSKPGKNLAILDIDEFAAINGALGHEFGDCVLKVVCQRLQEQLTDCVIARVGSDVFGILGPRSQVNPASLHSLFQQTFSVAGEVLRLSSTIGLVNLDEHALYGSELLKDAHVALKRAKNTSRGGAIYFSEPMGKNARQRIKLLSGLREALHKQQLFMVYQPKVILTNARPTGMEALIRWRLPCGDMVPPDLFIPLAEQSGLIVPIGNFVLQTSCQYLADIRAQGHTNLSMAINVSQMQLREPDFVENLASILSSAGVPPEYVELEITETIAVDDLKRINKSLNRILALGVKIAIDDFGTGYSSLSILGYLPAGRLKIDRSFIHDILEDDRIARMVISLGHSLNMDITAEGVENEEQRHALINLDCSEAQGWLFSRPMEGPAMIQWLEKHNR